MARAFYYLYYNHKQIRESRVYKYISTSGSVEDRSISAKIHRRPCIMDGGRFGVLVLFFLGLTWSCDARNTILLQPFAHENQVCQLCDKYATLGIKYLQDDDNQNAIVEALHMSCSQIPPLKKECLSMVDQYTQLLFTQVSVMKSDQICKKLNLCQAVTALASTVHQGNCEACRETVSELVTKLKDPETKLKIIRLLLKECKSLNNYQDKCKKMVFEYGPLMLADLEKFLEKKDVCSILGVCRAPALDTLAVANS